MQSNVEEYTRNGLKVEIRTEDYPESPREMWDNLGVMICSHKKYILGDEQFDASEYNGWEELKQHLIKERGAVVILPLSLYDHSGITMSVGVSNGWDSGQVGFIYVDKATLRKEFGDGPEVEEKAEKILRQEVETYDQYLIGDVFGFVVTNPKTGEEIDDLWGIYGIQSTREEANSVADYFEHPHEAAYAKKASALHA